MVINNLLEYYKLNAPLLRDEAERIADDCFTKNILVIRSKGYEVEKLNMLLHPLRTIRMELFALRLHFAYLQFQLTNINWWRTTHHPTPTNPQIFHMIESLDMNIKRGFIIGVFSVQEHTLRTYLREIDSTILNNAKAPYWKIKKHYLDNYIDPSVKNRFNILLSLFSNIRNCFHNDGVFYPNDEKDIEINYRNTTYKFINENPIDFVDWILLLAIIED